MSLFPAGSEIRPGNDDARIRMGHGRYLGEIPQAAETYSVIGNMNEHQLVIAESTFGGRHELVDTTGLIDYGTLIYTTLQRARTAREAIAVMNDLVTKYGYCSEGESFSIADPNEVWHMEMIGKGVEMKDGANVNRGAVWVAVKVPDGYISMHANQARHHAVSARRSAELPLFARSDRVRQIERAVQRARQRVQLRRGFRAGRLQRAQGLRSPVSGARSTA